MKVVKTNSVCDLEGTEITTDANAQTGLLLPSLTWVITEKLKEISHLGDQKDIDDGLGSSIHCPKTAFLRIYQQIPITETQDSKSSIRAKQAIPTKTANELKLLKELMQKGCEFAPKLLGYQEAQQESDDIVPSGFITYIVWEKVPEVPLSQYSWTYELHVRDAIRAKFRRVYQHMLGCKLYGPINRKEEWSDVYYVLYGLAKQPDRVNWHVDSSEWGW
ncbi:uncharacterized protein N7518_009065 [Penicillium psychrosexuale]|uniref:uncharacterized protein n=1 Tax=Penicillium psychrosexuale TaxID=1002107 RepID=UPI0025452930|nr:uncharacterized protein N7518_009065 [Penicillium psychrosexuale]KAJ5783388.1 hypothetical protein N7518_009065 [Penicillium psychrosexuale]